MLDKPVLTIENELQAIRNEKTALAAHLVDLRKQIRAAQAEAALADNFTTLQATRARDERLAFEALQGARALEALELKAIRLDAELSALKTIRDGMRHRLQVLEQLDTNRTRAELTQARAALACMESAGILEVVV